MATFAPYAHIRTQKNRPPIIAVCLYMDGGMIYDTMSVAEIEHTRNTFSKAPNSKAWKDSYGEMCKKTVLRRLCKLIDLNFDTAEAMQAFEDGSDFNVKGEQKEPEKAVDILDVEAKEITDEVDG